MGTINDPDIQSAPVYPVLFEMKQGDQTVQKINLQNDFVIRCSVYVPSEMLQQLNQQEHFVYVTLIDDGKLIGQKIGVLNPTPNKEINVLQLAIAFKLDSDIDNDQINLQMAITSKHSDEMGIGESLRIGRFINTYIPVENSHE